MHTHIHKVEFYLNKITSWRSN